MKIEREKKSYIKMYLKGICMMCGEEYKREFDKPYRCKHCKEKIA